MARVWRLKKNSIAVQGTDTLSSPHRNWPPVWKVPQQCLDLKLPCRFSQHPMFLLFLTLVAFFHVSEFALAATYDRENLGHHSWLVSPPYCLALLAACTEYWVESALFPAWKTHTAVSVLGLVAAIVGEVIRKTGIVTAGSSFTHHIRHEKDDRHRLVTGGIYRYIRHPGYLGWFIWSVALQLMLCNPVCLVAFTIVSWRFFATRIPYEEHFLLSFFGDSYDAYRERTPTYIPFIR